MYCIHYIEVWLLDCQVDRVKLLTGDERVNEQSILTVMHTIWLREHNRIEDVLHDVNPDWTGEVLYQETRRIVGAMMAHITYAEFLPILLGPRLMKKYGLNLASTGYYNGRWWRRYYAQAWVCIMPSCAWVCIMPSCAWVCIMPSCALICFAVNSVVFHVIVLSVCQVMALFRSTYSLESNTCLWLQHLSD